MLSAYVVLSDAVLEYIDLFVQKVQEPELFLEKIEEILQTSILTRLSI